MAVPARPVECEDISEEEMPGLLGANLFIPTRLRVVNVGYVQNFVSLYFLALTTRSSLAGFTIQASSGALAPFMVDGGFAIEGRAADSVGILYPGERMDIFLKMDESATLNLIRLHVSLDPEYVQCERFFVTEMMTQQTGTSDIPTPLSNLTNHSL